MFCVRQQEYIVTPRSPSVGSKDLGNHAESVAQVLLHQRGYNADLHRTNHPIYDLVVDASTPFHVSVKASKTQQHVRLGSLNSVSKLSSGNFVFAFMPSLGSKEISISDGGYRLFIIPAEIARDDGIAVRNSYLEHRGLDQSYSYSLMVKGYAKREHQVQIWSQWAQYEDAWHLLPPPKPAA
ncbi:hypothetical protein HDN1F_29980 [gamma proteobacterium HdN1]|nr:hypothetical protein HDN1F_29980 [gamma proteobacterium HdN1]